MKLKVCGMKLNTREVAELKPDYLGFIFWEPSSRFFKGEIPSLPPRIKKVGVFVDATVEEVLQKIKKYDLQAVQLHGKESPEFCEELRVRSSLPRPQSDSVDVRSSAVDTYDPSTSIRSGPMSTFGETSIEIIKVFSIKDNFNFSILKPYEDFCDYFMFDTKGKLPGGNGYAFDWSILKNYPSTKPYFLSGGIGPEEAESIKAFMKRPEAKYCHAIDLNSRFEIKPGLKDVKQLKNFKTALKI